MYVLKQGLCLAWAGNSWAQAIHLASASRVAGTTGTCHLSWCSSFLTGFLASAHIPFHSFSYIASRTILDHIMSLFWLKLCIQPCACGLCLYL
jgi:hypothetical protein